MGALMSGPGRGVWRIGESKIQGKGVMATRDLLPGSLVGVGIGYRMGLFPSVTEDLGAWINHSYKPNAQLMSLDGQYWIVSTTFIPQDDEITLDYRKTPW